MTQKTITFGIPRSVVFEMEFKGAPLPPGVHAPSGKLDGPFVITCTEAEARAMEAWLRSHQHEEPDYKAAADGIAHVLRQEGRR